MKPLPSVEYLRECFDYDPSTGVLTWKFRPRSHFPTARWWGLINTKYAGKTAGHLTVKGYYNVEFGGYTLYAHRIIWKMQTGEDPKHAIDHINGDKVDNRFCNLREANNRQNVNNTGFLCTNTSGAKNVHLEKRKGREPRWVVLLRSFGKTLYKKRFKLFEDAATAAQAARERLHGDFANHG